MGWRVNPRTWGNANIGKALLDKPWAPWWSMMDHHDWSTCISTSKSHWMEETRECVYSGGRGSEVSGKKGWVLMVGELICPSPWRSVTSLKGKPVRYMGHRAGNLISNETRKQLHHWLKCIENHRNGKDMLQDSALHHEATKNINF